jgi:hypothetical protein
MENFLQSLTVEQPCGRPFNAMHPEEAGNYLFVAVRLDGDPVNLNTTGLRRADRAAPSWTDAARPESSGRTTDGGPNGAPSRAS